MNIDGENITDLIRRRFAGTQPPKDFSARGAAGDLPPGFLPAPPWKPASVLVPVVLHPDPTLLLTRRTEQLQDHAGQVSFPGGGREHLEVVGFLDGYLTVSGYAVTPVVALVAPGFELRLDPLEVAEVFEVPLAFLADPLNRQVRQRRLGDRDVSYYVFEYGPHFIWGATAGMLVNFLDKLTGPRA